MLHPVHRFSQGPFVKLARVTRGGSSFDQDFSLMQAKMLSKSAKWCVMVVERGRGMQIVVEKGPARRDGLYERPSRELETEGP